MTENSLTIIQSFNRIEIIYVLILFFLLFFLIPFFVKSVTKNDLFFQFTILSLFLSGVITITTLWILNSVFNIEMSYILSLSPIVILFVYILNVGTCVGYYKLHEKRKSFNYIELKKEFVRDSIQLSVFILLMFSALSFFLSSTFLTFILLTGGLSLTTIWVNYALLYRIVK
jgi:hypothetical protein